MENSSPKPDPGNAPRHEMTKLILFVVIGVPVAYILLMKLFAAFVPGRLE